MTSRPRLCYSVKKVRSVRGVCFLSGGRESRESRLISGGFNKWKRAICQSKKKDRYFDKHAKSADHREADVRVMGFLNPRHRPGRDIQSKLAKQPAIRGSEHTMEFSQ